MGKKYSLKMLIGSIIAGLVYGIIGEIIYSALKDNVSSIILTLIYFTGLFLFIGLSVFLISRFVYSQYQAPVYRKAWLISFILILVLSVMFEFIYDLISEHRRITDYDSYLFLVDNSGSMSDSDPENIRYDAVRELLKDKDDTFEYGIYLFSDYPERIRDMGSIKDGGDWKVEDEPYGGTAIYGTLSAVIDDLDKGDLNIDSDTRVILLSDGEPTDVHGNMTMMRLLKVFTKNEISVSTVGLLYANDDFMSMIADKTGGVYVNCQDVRTLDQAIKEASVSNNIYRNLLGYRSGLFLNWLLALIRILFVGALGIVIAVEKTAICEKFIDTTSVLISSAAGGILAGICIEIGMNTIGIEQKTMRIITCILIAFTLLREDIFIQEHANNDLYKKEKGWI